MEGVVLLMVALAPWFYGAVDPFSEYALFAGISLLGVLWALRSAIEGHFLWFTCPIALCLALMFALGVIQIIPLPKYVAAVASPAAVSLNSELRPFQPEVIVEGDAPSSSTPWYTISVYPSATRQWLVRLLAIFILFSAIRVNIASTPAMQRFAWVSFGTGVALSVFAVYQFAHQRTAGPHVPVTVLGSQTRGIPFGPFICRNHFPDFVNICIGLSIGLLLTSGRSESDKRARRTHKAQALVEQTAEDESTVSILSILHSPLQLWLSVGLAIMIGAVVCSLSRGGVAALILGIIATLILRGRPATRRVARLELLIIPVLLVVGFLTWLGIKPLESRLVTLDSESGSSGRLVIWRNLVPLVWRFPIFGSGAGTLQFVEPLTRSMDYLGFGAPVDLDHAHNDYLEALIEGGIGRLFLMVAIVFFLVRFGRQAMRRHELRTPGRLAFGALVGIAALVFHSAVDFGFTTPAVTLLAVVTSAYLSAMARSDPSEPPSRRSKHAIVVEGNGFGGIAAAVGLMLIGLVLLRHGWVMTRVDELRMGAFRAMRQMSPPNPDLARSSLQIAAKLAPDNATLRSELGQVYLDELRFRRKAQEQTRGAAAAVVMAGPTVLDHTIAAMAAPTAVATPMALAKKEFEEFVKPGLQNMIAARDLCPLLARPQARLALYAHDAHPENGITMAKSDPELAYWTRAVRLAPFDPDLLFYYGQTMFKAGEYDKTWEAWRQSLHYKPTHLRAMIAAALPKIGPEGIASKLLPDDPAVTLEVARYMTSRPEMSEALRRILLSAKQSLLSRSDNLDAEASRLLGQCHRMLGETEPAISAYRQAITLAPERLDWRYEFAEFLYSIPTERARADAIMELDAILQANPHYGPATNLRSAIEREKGER